MTDSLDVLGQWWLPEHADHRVAGRLTWNIADGGTLDLLGEIRPVVILDNVSADGTVQNYRPARPRAENQFPVIHGSQGDKMFTLLDSFSRNGVGLRGLTEGHEQIAVNGVLEGAWYTDSSDIEADRAIIDVRHLTEWVDTSGVSVRHPRFDDNDPDAPDTIVTAVRVRPFSATRGDITVEVTQHLDQLRDLPHASGVTESWRAVMRADPMSSLKTFTDVATDLRALVTIATGRTADIERVVIQHPHLHAYNLAGHPVPQIRENITYYSRWSHRGADQAALKRVDVFFTLAQFGGADALSRWLAAATTYGTELRRVMATRYTSSMYLEDRIMNVCASLESLDAMRTSRPSPRVKLRDRLESCVDFAGPEFLTFLAEPVDEWRARVVRARNELAHHGTDFRLNATAGDHLLSEQLYWLFVHCLVRISDADQAAFDAIHRHRELRWLTEQATKQREQS